MAEAKKKRKWSYVIWGIISVIIGILLLFVPRLMVLADLIIGVIIGVALIITGVFRVVYYCRTQKKSTSTILDLIFGIFLILIGLGVIARPIFGLSIFAVFISIGFIVVGLSAIANCVYLKKNGIKDWWIMIIIGIIFILAGILMLCNPAFWGVLLPVFTGIFFIIEGIDCILSSSVDE